MIATKFISILAFAVVVLTYTLPGHSSLQRQVLAKRAKGDLTEDIYRNLPATEIDFVNHHIKNLTDASGSKCDKCKNRLKYAKSLVEEFPEQEHLVSLLLYKDCVNNNAKKPNSCNLKEFFITTDSQNFEAFNDNFDSGITSGTSVN
ncbi:hypothetical protein CANMA_005006, partial [Candida margitis]|uniref:uncharacterized protein n=1 Tax=Candida margitis TaxID=1775924 RepID=UPI002227A6E8